MAKKLTVEVDAETTKAKRKIQQLAETGGSPGGGAVPPDGADRAAKSMGKLARSAKNVADESERSSASIGRLAKSFAGLAAGMAAGYAANHMDPGAGRTSMGYLASILSGASTGAAVAGMVPGVGTGVGIAVGAAGGAAKQFMDNSKMEDDWFKDFRTSEDKLKATRGWAEKFDEMISVKTHFKGLEGMELLKAQLKEVEAASARTADAIKLLKSAEQESVNIINGLQKSDLTADEKIAKGNKESEELAFTRQKLAQSEGAAKRLYAMRENLVWAMEKRPTPEARASMDALDSLARVGGNFAGSDAGFRDLQRINEKQVALLEKIEAKTGKGSGTF